MIITLVTDQFYQSGHGTSVSAQHFYNGLVEKGHTVRVLAYDSENNTPYALKERCFGKLATKIINSQGFQFAKPDKAVIKKAIEGADIVHVYTPFKLGYTTIKMCRQLNIPCTAAFHITPENISSTAYLNHSHLFNSYIWHKWHNSTYRFVKHIHCPSLMVANRLKKHKFNSNLHVISNGYQDIFKFQPEAKPTIFQNKFVILETGRFSREKRCDLLISAIKKSKHKDKIQLILAGKGPTKKQCMRSAKSLPNFPIFLGAYNRQQQISFLNFADLYVHPADIEVEGMTCIEAIACGCVPVVSNSPKSATPQFVVHKNSIFKKGDAADLAKKIDWWIEHPQELLQQKSVIAQHAKRFTLQHSMDFYIKMFEAAIQDWDNKYDDKSKTAIKPNIINNYASPAATENVSNKTETKA